ncbi:S1C family serine protease [Mycobacterium genavense]|uniref:S1C family serine protease n=1 Tax=Mycobacterium genavense TaxID=36812 RepID=UPI000564270E|nr:S1C family serine protease [Mycobacterium genavense]
MSKGHPRSVWWSWLVSVLAVVGLGLGLTTVPAAATTFGPSAPAQDRFRDAPMFPLDLGAIAAQVGPQIVNISTRFGYNNAIGAGTGIVIDPAGVVLTNNHVISAATDISGFDVGNGQTYAVDVIGYSRSADIAVLQLRGAGGLPAAVIGGGVAVGEPVVALGNTHGQGGAPSVVPGKVVALNQTVSATDTLTGADETLGGLIQADTAIKPGDSGGPLVNNAGQVVGVDTAATDSYKMSGGQGFAIPIGRAMGVANQIRSGAGSNSVHIGPTAFIGMGVAENGGNGARVQRLVAGGPAAGSGIAPGDVIVAVDNVPINGPTAMTDVLVPHHPGDVITLHWRAAAGGDRSAPVTLGDGPPA